MNTATFGEALQAGFLAGKRLCVGIDPHGYLLEASDLPDTASGAEQFAMVLVNAAADHALAVKPQVAFFERFGSAGYALLERVILAAREANLLVIADAKRGDVGTSFDAYAEAWLSPGAPLEADALTVSAFQGFAVLQAALDLSLQHGKGLFVLVATSNPEAAAIQQATLRDGRSVSSSLMRDVERFNHEHSGEAAVANVGAVLGATLRLADYGLEVRDINAPTSGPITPILAPGFGHQGGQLEEAKVSFGHLMRGVIVTESRSLVSGGLTSVPERVREKSLQLSSEVWGS